jgi:hypothetical protein
MRFWLLLVLALAACKAERARPNHASSSRSKARTGHLGGLPTSPKGGGSKARPALVVRKATVVAFWLPGADTLDEGDASDALEDLRAGSGHLAGYLKDQEIVVVGSVSDSIWVEAANGPRRLVMLVGLDYPYGYVLIDPGYPEQIITGESSDEELQDATGYRCAGGSYAEAAAPSRSRTFCVSAMGVNGFSRKAAPGPRIPWLAIAS